MKMTVSYCFVNVRDVVKLFTKNKVDIQTLFTLKLCDAKHIKKRQIMFDKIF